MENRWEEVLQPLLPKGWYPASREAIDDFYNGISGAPADGAGWRWSGRSPGAHGRARCWSGPASFCCAISLMICIVSLLSRQPLYNERMNFPLLRVPILMQEAIDEDRLWAFLTHRYLLVGLMIPVVPAPDQRAQFLQSVDPLDPDPDAGGQVLSQSRPVFRFLQTQDLHLSGLHRICVPDRQAGVLFVLVLFSRRRAAGRPAERAGHQHPGGGARSDLRPDPVPARRNPGDRRLPGVLFVSRVAGAVSLSRHLSESLRPAQGRRTRRPSGLPPGRRSGGSSPAASGSSPGATTTGYRSAPPCWC